MLTIHPFVAATALSVAVVCSDADPRVAYDIESAMKRPGAGERLTSAFATSRSPGREAVAPPYTLSIERQTVITDGQEHMKLPSGWGHLTVGCAVEKVNGITIYRLGFVDVPATVQVEKNAGEPAVIDIERVRGRPVLLGLR